MLSSSQVIVPIVQGNAVTQQTMERRCYHLARLYCSIGVIGVLIQLMLLSGWMATLSTG
jgi:hypothetical protein